MFFWLPSAQRIGKEFTCNSRDLGSIPGLGRSPGGGHGNPLQYSCLENPRGQRSLAAYSPWGHKKSDMTEQQSTAQHRFDKQGNLYMSFVLSSCNASRSLYLFSRILRVYTEALTGFSRYSVQMVSATLISLKAASLKLLPLWDQWTEFIF